MERVLLEYLVNSVWQVPVVAAAAWFATRVVRPSVRVQHGVWVAALIAAVMIPAVPIRGAATGRLGVVEQVAQASAAADFFSAGGGIGEEANAASESALDKPAAGVSTPPDVLPKRAGWHLSGRETRMILYLYVALIALGLLRLLRSSFAARRLVDEAVAAELGGRDAALVERCCREMGVDVVEIRCSERVWSPLVVGIRRPVIVLPHALGCVGAMPDLEAVLWHELAHVRRRDYLANLMCRVWALPIVYHPAAHFMMRRVRRTREMVCDGMAAERMSSRVEYARRLVDLAGAAKLTATAAAEGTAMFGDGALEERVMELLGTKQTVSAGMRVLRGAIGAASFAGVLGAAVLLHVKPTLAETPADEVRPAAGVQAVVQASPVKLAKPPARVEPVIAVSAPVELQQSAAARMDGPRELTPEEKAQLDKQLAEAKRTIDEALKDLKDGEIQKKLDEALRNLNSAEVQKQMADAMKQAKALDSAEMQKKRADAVGKAQVQMHSPEFRRRMEELNSPEFRKRLEEQAKRSAEMAEKSVEMQKHMAEMQSHIQERVKESLLSAGPESGSDKELYESGMGALNKGQFEAARTRLQALVDTFPQSAYMADAKRGIAQSWDAEGTVALVHAENEYEAAGVSAKPLGEGITPPMLIKQVNPEYTPEAKAAKLKGAVLVNLWVDEQGNVQHVRVLRGLGSGLDEKAIDAARQYKFKPAMENGKPVMVALNVEVNFQIF